MPRRSSNKFVRTARRLGIALALTSLIAIGIVALRWHYREQRFNALIEEIAPRYGVDKFLVKAVMRRESKFDPLAHSSKGAIGLMQVTPAAGEDWAAATGRKEFSAGSLWIPRVNIEAGAWYLARALRRWEAMDDPLPFALAEYNAGRGNVERWLPAGPETTAAQFQEAITYPGVRRYIESVTEYYRDYKERRRL
jgi:soluble lytic murein transglycosylase